MAGVAVDDEGEDDDTSLRGNRFHDAIRERISAQPLSPAKRGVAVMVLGEIIRWLPAPGAGCTKSLPDIARLLNISLAETTEALKTLRAINAVRQVRVGPAIALHVVPLGAGAVPLRLREQISHAIECHSSWKTRLRHAIDTGCGELALDEVGRDDLCAFGQWLNGPDFARIGNDSDYQLVLYLHAQFHKIAADTYALACSGRPDLARKAMSAGGAFAAISLRLVKALSMWRKNAP